MKQLDPSEVNMGVVYLMLAITVVGIACGTPVLMAGVQSGSKLLIAIGALALATAVLNPFVLASAAKKKPTP
jgi:hypothetical protein